MTVIIYGATPAGLLSAIAAARKGKTVQIIAPEYHIGGMVTGGLGATDVANTDTIGGISKEFLNNVYNKYISMYGMGSQQVKDSAGGYRFEPSISESVLLDMVSQESNISIQLQEPIDYVTKIGTVIQSITTKLGNTYFGSEFIDGTYEGDLLALAGVSYVIGRESSSDYNESYAGVRHVSGCSNLDPVGTGDLKTQSYTYRLCATKDNFIPWSKPDNYDVSKYDFLSQLFLKNPNSIISNVITFTKLPNNKYDLNHIDNIGMNWDYPNGSMKDRDSIIQEHISYQKGFLWYLSTDSRVPLQIQNEINSWGLADDEFMDNNNWPYQLYVRECKRMVGSYVLTQIDLLTQTIKSSSISIGSYTIDSHHVQKIIADNGDIAFEGNIDITVPTYSIPYQCIVPKATECTNLIVPVCISATHIAFGSIRMELNWMMLGEVAGIAACLAIDSNRTVQNVDNSTLRCKIYEAGIPICPDQCIRPMAIDDKQALKVGLWIESCSIAGFIGPCYIHDGNIDKGTKSVTFTGALSGPGLYDVLFYYTSCSNRATNVPVRINGQLVYVNERLTPSYGGYINLGTFYVPSNPKVIVSTEGTDGYVVADAVRFVKKS
jgi:hypothetical protein